MSEGPPPSAGPPLAGGEKRTTIELEAPAGGLKRLLAKRGPTRITISASDIMIEHGTFLRAPLILAPGGIAVAALDPGPAKADKNSQVGRFPVLHRMSATTVLPREEGIDGWVWTAGGGSAMTYLGDEDTAPNLALIFLRPLDEHHVVEVFEPSFLDELTKHSPLGTPTVFGVLLRVDDVEAARTALQRISLLRDITDREVPPTQRRHLPTDKPANPTVLGGDGGRAATSIPPPGGG